MMHSCTLEAILSCSWSAIYCIPLQSIFAELGPYTLDFTSSGRYMAVSGRKGHLGIVDMINLSLIREFQVCSVLVELSMWGFTFTNKFLNSFYVSEHCLIFFFSRVMFIVASLDRHHLVLILTIHILKHCFYLSE